MSYNPIAFRDDIITHGFITIDIVNKIKDLDLEKESDCEPCDGADGCGKYKDKDICLSNNGCKWFGWENGPGCNNFKQIKKIAFDIENIQSIMMHLKYSIELEYYFYKEAY